MQVSAAQGNVSGYAVDELVEQGHQLVLESEVDHGLHFGSDEPDEVVEQLAQDQGEVRDALHMDLEALQTKTQAAHVEVDVLVGVVDGGYGGEQVEASHRDTGVAQVR